VVTGHVVEPVPPPAAEDVDVVDVEEEVEALVDFGAAEAE